MQKKAVFIIAQKDFHDIEYSVPKKILDQRNIITKTAAKLKKPAEGKLGATVNPDLAIENINPNDFDAIVLIGGRGACDYLEDEIVIKIVQDFKKSNKIIGAICLAPSILANAGVLIGKTATATASQEENLRNKGADYTGMPLEVDGLVVTAKGPDAAEIFGEKLAYLLEE